MLVIARRKGESIVIGDDVEIVVTEVTRTTVKLAISAPRGRRVLRGEVHRSIGAANRSAAQSNLTSLPQAVPVASTDALRALTAAKVDAPSRQRSDTADRQETGTVAEPVEAPVAR